MLQDAAAMPVRQLFEPASIPGLAHDHSYMELSMEDDFLQRFKVTHISPEEVQEIEAATRDQASSKRWQEERKKRLTSSYFGEICKATDRKNKTSFAESLMTERELKTAAITHGRKYEVLAVEKYEQLTSVKTSKCGLFVSVQNPFLAASPDRIIDAKTILEVKCPYSARDREITPVSVPYLKPLSSPPFFKLDPTHAYYYQIQGQLLCSGRQSCLFLVYTLKDMKVIEVNLDEPFVAEMVAKLRCFFEEFFREALVNKYFYKNYSKYF